MKNTLNLFLTISLSFALLFVSSCNNDDPSTNVTVTETVSNLDSKLYGLWKTPINTEYVSFSSNGNFFQWYERDGNTVLYEQSGEWWVQDGRLFKLSNNGNTPIVNSYSFSGDTLIITNFPNNSTSRKFVKE